MSKYFQSFNKSSVSQPPFIDNMFLVNYTSKSQSILTLIRGFRAVFQGSRFEKNYVVDDIDP